MRHCRVFPITILVALVGVVAAVSATPVSAATFTVNLTIDGADVNLADGACDADAGTDGDQCTLRAAVEQANASAGPDVIILPSDTLTLTIAGDEDAGVSGDLDVTSAVTIAGINSAQSIIQAGADTASGDAGFLRLSVPRKQGW